jgi:hypothetical protein
VGRSGVIRRRGRPRPPVLRRSGVGLGRLRRLRRCRWLRSGRRGGVRGCSVRGSGVRGCSVRGSSVRRGVGRRRGVRRRHRRWVEGVGGRCGVRGACLRLLKRTRPDPATGQRHGTGAPTWSDVRKRWAAECADPGVANAAADLAGRCGGAPAPTVAVVGRRAPDARPRRGQGPRCGRFRARRPGIGAILGLGRRRGGCHRIRCGGIRRGHRRGVGAFLRVVGAYGCVARLVRRRGDRRRTGGGHRNRDADRVGGRVRDSCELRRHDMRPARIGGRGKSRPSGRDVSRGSRFCDGSGIGQCDGVSRLIGPGRALHGRRGDGGVDLRRCARFFRRFSCDNAVVARLAVDGRSGQRPDGPESAGTGPRRRKLGAVVTDGRLRRRQAYWPASDRLGALGGVTGSVLRWCGRRIGAAVARVPSAGAVARGSDAALDLLLEPRRARVLWALIGGLR